MPDPVNTVITDITKVEQALEAVAVPKAPFDTTLVADKKPVLDTAGSLLKLLYGNADIKKVGGDIAGALGDAAKLLHSVADTLKTIINTGGNVTQTLQALQNALATAQAIVPGSPPALTAGSQFFGQIGSILTAANNDVTAAANVLYKFAQQLSAIAAALKP